MKFWRMSLPKYSTLSYYLGKLIGLAPFTVKNKRFYSPTLLGQLYPFLLVTSFLLTTVESPQRFATDNYSIIFQIAGRIHRFVNFPSVFSTAVTFIIMHEKIVHYMNKMCNVGDKFKNLGIMEDHENFFKNLFVSAVVANTTLIGAFIVIFQFHRNIYVSIGYGISSWIGFNTILIFAHMLICIKNRFTILNQELYGLLIPAGQFRLSNNSRIFLVSENAREENDPQIKNPTDLQRIRMIKALHLELKDLVNQTAHLLAIPIILNTFLYSIEYMMASYWIYILVRESAATDIITVLYISLRTLTKTVALYIMMYASDATCKQGNATKHVLCDVSIELEQPELLDECFAFSNQLMHMPVTVSAFGILDLGYSLILQITCIVITYVIIMVQLDSSD